MRRADQGGQEGSMAQWAWAGGAAGAGCHVRLYGVCTHKNLPEGRWRLKSAPACTASCAPRHGGQTSRGPGQRPPPVPQRGCNTFLCS